MMKILLLCFLFLTIGGKPKASVAFCVIAFAVVGTQCLKLDGKHYLQMKDSHLLNAITTTMTIEMRIRVSSFTNERTTDKLNVVHLPYGWTEDPSQWQRDWSSRREEIIGQLVLKYSPPIKATFAVLADAKNYPVMYYCRGGIDRSIIVTGILYLALGVSEKDIFAGYGQFGALRRGNHEKYILRTAFSYVDKVGGILKYLKYIGVPDEHLQQLKQKMLR
jgi:hypothetical protein